MNDKNFEWIISVLKNKIPDFLPDPYEIIGFCEYHRVAGLVYNRAKKLKINLHPKIEKSLKEAYLKQKRKRALFKDHVKEIAKKLNEIGGEYVFLKGTVFNYSDEFVFYEPGERGANDVDILTEQKHVGKVENALKDIGLTQGRFNLDSGEIVPFSRAEILNRRLNRGEVAPFVKKTGDPEFPFIEVDVNFSLGNTPNEYEDVIRDILKTRLNESVDFPARLPDKERFLIHLILHQYKESTLYFMVERGKDSDLYKLADIYYLLNSGAIDKIKLNELIKKYDIEKEFAVVAGQVYECFGGDYAMFFPRGNVAQPPVYDYYNKRAYTFCKSVYKRITECAGTEALKEI